MLQKSGNLGKLLYRFAVISDTHVNPADDRCNSPFPVNVRANRRFRHIISDLNQREISFVLHLGDHVHPVPGTIDLYRKAANAYRSIESELKVVIHRIPGNHDIGDTPIEGAPANPTTSETVAAWTTEFGKQYHAFSVGNVRYFLINAQLVNSQLPDEIAQREWLEAELSKTDDRKILALHHPIFICHPDESNHYDNTRQPGRDWLLELLERFNVEAVFSGHAHNFWYNRYGNTDYYLAPATSFVRQDYSELFRTAPPANSEHGRDDFAKLGYFVVSIYESGHTVQIVRSWGDEMGVDDKPKPPIDFAPTPRENPNTLIGFDLRHNWAEVCEVPPMGGLDEFDRKLARNDYVLLALIEMGVRNIRIPLTDLRNRERCNRLEHLCHLGFCPTIFSFGIPLERDLELIEEFRGIIADWEITIDWESLEHFHLLLKEANKRTGLPVYLSRMRSKSDLPQGSLYFHVINHGFSPDDSERIEQLLDLKESGLVGVVFRLGNQEPVKKTLQKMEQLTRKFSMQASVHLRVAGDNPAEAHTSPTDTLERIECALDFARQSKQIRIFCDSLMDNDRGYFVRDGAIDRNGNPRPLLELVRSAHIRQWRDCA